MINGCGGLVYSLGAGEAVLLLMLTLTAVFPTSTASCGGYLKLTETSGFIESPNYPDHYPNMAHCIWQLEAPTDHVITMTVTAVRGEADYTEQCIDYVEIRNGSGMSTVMFKLCVSSSPVSLQSTDRWLWVRFKSNHVTTNSGFRASWATAFVPPLGTLKGVSPIPECQPVKFRCANKECISKAYVCDNANDCGCEGPDCDEHGCGGFHWSQMTRLVVGVFIGVAVFLLVFFGVGFLEIFLKRRAEKEYLKQMDVAKKRARLQRNKPTTGDTKVVPTPDGVKLDVPPVRTPSPGGSSSPALTPRSVC